MGNALQRFFLLTFAISWLSWAGAWGLGGAPAGMALVLLGAFGPSAAALVVAARSSSGPGAGELLRRSVDPWRIPTAVWPFVVLLFPAMVWVGRIVDGALGGQPAPLDLSALSAPVPALGFLLLILLAGPVSEEIGWRGYALDPWQRRRGALVASLGLGVVWVLWHLPLFVIPGTSQYPLGIGTPAFWLWSVQVLCLSLIFTAIYNRTRFSALSAILLHSFANLTYSLFVPIGDVAPIRAEIVSTAVHVAVALAVVAIGLGVPRAATGTLGKCSEHRTSSSPR